MARSIFDLPFPVCLYRSQFQTEHDRALSKAQAIRTKLGGPDCAGIDEFDPPKPKGMRWRTYHKLICRSREQEAIADERLIFFLDQWSKTKLGNSFRSGSFERYSLNSFGKASSYIALFAED